MTERDVEWPAVIWFEDGSGLWFVDRQEWHCSDLQEIPFDAGDRLIDSRGLVFRMEFLSVERGTRLVPTGEHFGEAEIKEVMNRHLRGRGDLPVKYAQTVERVGEGDLLKATIRFGLRHAHN